MININKIRIFVIEYPDIYILDGLELFDVSEIGKDVFIGLAVDSRRLRDELDGLCSYSSYAITDTDQIDKQYANIVEPIITYCGIKHTINGILDIMLDETIDYNRKFYLESVLYFKSNQKGKKLNKLNLFIRHFDDFSYQFSEDIFSYEIISNNDDFSETRVIIETYLTEQEAINKFNDYLIN